MPFNSSAVTYIHGPDDKSYSCPIYGFYIGHCGNVTYTNDFIVTVNGVRLNDFLGAKTPQEYLEGNTTPCWNNCNQPCRPYVKYCPNVLSQGAPMLCLDQDIRNNWPNQCGGEKARLYMFTAQTPFAPGVFPNGKVQPNGAKWPEPTYYNSLKITWNPQVQILGETFSINKARIEPTQANEIALDSYLARYKGTNCTYCSSFLLPNGEEGRQLFSIPLEPAALKATGGCIGIIEYKKINGYLQCERYIPLKLSEQDQFSNLLAYQNGENSELWSIVYNWWTEAHIPLEKPPSWVPDQNYIQYINKSNLVPNQVIVG